MKEGDHVKEPRFSIRGKHALGILPHLTSSNSSTLNALPTSNQRPLWTKHA